jgi:hypothetical protein
MMRVGKIWNVVTQLNHVKCGDLALSKSLIIGIITLLSVASFTEGSFAANKAPANWPKYGKGTWIECKKFKRLGSVLIRIDAKGNWFCWTGRAR